MGNNAATPRPPQTMPKTVVALLWLLALAASPAIAQAVPREQIEHVIQKRDTSFQN